MQLLITAVIRNKMSAYSFADIYVLWEFKDTKLIRFAIALSVLKPTSNFISV